MADIFREVEEDLRRERGAKLWRKYGRYVIAAAALAVLGVAGTQAWQAYDLDRRQELSNRFAAALDSAGAGETEAALDALAELSAPGEGGYRGLAAFEEARLRAESGDTAGAIAIWDRLAASDTLGTGMRSAATLFSVLHQMDSAEPQALQQRLQPLTQEGHPFRPVALELTALLALRQGEEERARELYRAVADDREAPSGSRGRAAQMLAALGD